MGYFDITPRELRSNKECGLKSFLAIKIVKKKRFFGLLSPTYETIVVAHTRAINFAWAELKFKGHDIFTGHGLDYDYFIEVKDRVYHPKKH